LEDPSSLLGQAFLLSFFVGFGLRSLLFLLIIALLLLLSALISGSEVAFFSLEPSDMRRIDQSDAKVSFVISDLLKEPERLLATILIANNFVNIAIVILSAMLTSEVFNFVEYPIAGFIFQVIIITFILLLFGEVIPKIYANHFALRLSAFMAVPVKYLQRFLSPISTVLVRSTKIFDRGISMGKETISVDDLSHALEITSDENIDKDEQKILEGIVKFGNTDVKQIMKARMDVVAVEEKLAFDELLQEVESAGFSRIPVYKESFDEVAGIIYIKDLIPHLDHGQYFEWQELIRPPFFVPESKKIDDLLNEFQEKKMHLAIVVDEFGGTSGIVTLEDILEEIVGDIADEFDSDNVVYSKLDEQTYIFAGKTPLNDVYRILDIDGEAFEEVKGEGDTLAGFIIEIANRIPVKNESIDFLNYTFTIEAADKRKVSTIKMSIRPSEQNETNAKT
jgi:putative hemolysin